MRSDRRTTVAGAVLIGFAGVLLLDPLGVRGASASWIRVADPVSGSPRALASAVVDRADSVDSLEAALAMDPILSLALLATGLGLGLVAGGTVAYLHQRRRIRRGEHDG